MTRQRSLAGNVPCRIQMAKIGLARGKTDRQNAQGLRCNRRDRLIRGHTRQRGSLRQLRAILAAKYRRHMPKVARARLRGLCGLPHINDL